MKKLIRVKWLRPTGTLYAEASYASGEELGAAVLTANLFLKISHSKQWRQFRIVLEDESIGPVDEALGPDTRESLRTTLEAALKSLGEFFESGAEMLDCIEEARSLIWEAASCVS